MSKLKDKNNAHKAKDKELSRIHSYNIYNSAETTRLRERISLIGFTLIWN